MRSNPFKWRLQTYNRQFNAILFPVFVAHSSPHEHSAH
ncbi:hypothetical protein BN1013_00771 [Candidatus Rubidus massiliensis]|nr:hypothetical protein BN1013_00771 [Candidatus Rubidus massiliensis]